jgi:uncharacterized protein involved in response to NO
MTKPRANFVALCCAEPFRTFFPAGVVFGTVGVALWPLFYGHAIASYPSLAHARLMIEGMMAAFIFGFLGTAGPRLTETRTFSKKEVGGLLALQLSSVTLHLAWHPAWGDALFLATLLFFGSAMASRFAARSDLPPPNFVLVALGILSGVFGAAMLALTEAGVDSLRIYRIGGALLNQGFVLFPILGAGAFLLRKFLGVESPDEVPSMRAPTREWRTQAAFCGGVGAAIIGSFVMEAFDFPRIAGGIRAAAVVIYFVAATPMFSRAREPAFLAACLRLAMFFVTASALWIIFFPRSPLAGLHLLFIGGFSVSAFTVGARVILGHSGRSEACNMRMPFLIAAIALLMLALWARVAADFLLPSRVVHLIAAAICWLLATFIWSVKLLPRVRISDDSD